MAVELQVRESALAQALVEWVQARLFTLCVPTTSAMLVDHLDAVPGSVSFSNGADGGIDATRTVAIYAVSEADLLAHPNAVPDGSVTAAGQLGLLVRIGVRDRALTIVDARSLPAASGLPPIVLDEIARRVDDLLAPLGGTVLFDCAAIVTALGAFVPAEPDLGRAGGVVALRFGSEGATISQLGAGQAWGVFLDGIEAVGLLKRRIPAGIPVPVTINWVANGPTPAIVANAAIDLSPVGIDIAGVRAVITASPSFVAPATLRLSASWGVDLTGVFWLFESLARQFVRATIRRMLPDVNHNGAQTFFYDVALPPVPGFLGAQPRWAEITSSPAGMTIGGPVLPAPAGDRRVLDVAVHGFGRPVWWGHCRALAAGGDGTPPNRFEATNPSLRVQAGANFSDAGALCTVRILPPNEWLSESKGMTADLNGVGFDLTVGVAGRITSDVQIIVTTARGARFIDLRKPVIRPKEGGSGLDVQVNFLEDCLYLSGAWLKLALGLALTIDDFRTPPFETPDWRKEFHAERGLNSHLVTVDRLEPGEIITVRGRGLSVEVTANEDDYAIVPGLVAIAADMHEVIVERASMQRFEGTVSVQTLEFAWLAEVGPAEAAAVRDVDGAAYVARVDGDTATFELYRPGDERTFLTVGSEEVELNPQPIPPGSAEAARIAEAAGVQDVLSAQYMPGMEGRESVALISQSDGRTVIVSADSSTPRISGEYSGPLIGMQIDGDFAIAKSGDAVHLFAVRRPTDLELSNIQG